MDRSGGGSSRSDISPAGDDGRSVLFLALLFQGRDGKQVEGISKAETESEREAGMLLQKVAG